MKYDVGDVVIIRTDLVQDERYSGISINNKGQMDRWFGNTMTVFSVKSNMNGICSYRMKEDQSQCPHGWNWGEDMILHKCQEPEQIIVIPIDKKNTVRRINLRA